MEGDTTLSVQPCKHREVAELRWDGASELIVGEESGRARQREQFADAYSHIIKYI